MKYSEFETIAKENGWEIDIIKEILSKEELTGAYKFNIFKYLIRYKAKTALKT